MSFLVIGELINSTRSKVRQAIADRDADFIADLARRQARAGADFIDINAGADPANETDNLVWLAGVVQEACDKPLCLDSPNHESLAQVMAKVSQPPLLNSISLESGRFEPMLELIATASCSVVALCMSDEGMPTSSVDVAQRALRLVEALERAGMPRGQIHVDPLAQPVSVDGQNAVAACNAVKMINEQSPGVGTVCGLSNISYGLPLRRLVNRHFLGMLIQAGLSGAIMDPLDRELMLCIKTTEMLLGRDEYCMEFINMATTANE